MAGWRQVTTWNLYLKNNLLDLVCFYLLYLEDYTLYILSYKRILFPVLGDVAFFAQITELGFNAIKMEFMSSSVS